MSQQAIALLRHEQDVLPLVHVSEVGMLVTEVRHRLLDQVILISAPDVDVSQSVDQASITEGDTAGFTVTITNAGAATAAGVSLSDPLPAGLGGDVVWQTDVEPTRENGKNAWYGRAAHTKAPKGAR